MRCLSLLVLVAFVTGDWVLVARLEQDSPARRKKVGALSPAVCPTCLGKLADSAINDLMGNGVVKLELVRQATLDCRLLPNTVFFDVGIGNFDSLARRSASPFSFSETEAMAGNFTSPSLPHASNSSLLNTDNVATNVSNISNSNNNSTNNIDQNLNNSIIPASDRVMCNFGADLGTVASAYAWVVNDNCVNRDVCTKLMLVYVWLPRAPSPPSFTPSRVDANMTSTSVSLILLPYQDLLVYVAIAVAILLLFCSLFCYCYRRRKRRRKKAKKQAKQEERESALALQRSSLQAMETTSRSGSQPTSERNSLHSDPHTGAPLSHEEIFACIPTPISPPLSSSSGRTPPYTKSTFPSSKTILPLTPIKLPETTRSRTPVSPRSLFSSHDSPEHKQSPFRFAFLKKLSPSHPHHSRSNSSPEILARAPASTPVTRRGSTSSAACASPMFASGSCPYFVVRLLGKGHFGTAYLVTDSVNQYVLKTQTTARSESQKNDALKEVVSLGSFPSSPHLLAFRDFFFEGSVFCIVVNYCSGGSLLDQIPLRLGPDEVFRILAEVCAGLAIIHSKGFIHRDIKPDNLFFANPEERTVVIGDMGLARRVGADGYYSNSFGHALYKAPEVQYGKWSKRSDMWAVGCVGLDLLGGESMEERCQGQNMILGTKTDVELTEIIQVTVKQLAHPVVKVVRALLRVHPYRRLTAEQVIEYKAAVELDPEAEPPSNLTHARVKSSPLPSVCPSDLPSLPETPEAHQEEMFPDALAPDLGHHRSLSPLNPLVFPLSPPSPVLQPISLPPSPVLKSRKFSFSVVRKEPSVIRMEDVGGRPEGEPSIGARSRIVDEETPEEFSPLVTPVVFYSAE